MAIKRVFSIAGLILIFWLAGDDLNAQTMDRKLEASVVVTSINLRALDSREAGGGVRLAYNLTDYLAIEAEGNLFEFAIGDHPTDDLLGAQGLLGIKAGLRARRIGVFAKLRPGVVNFPKFKVHSSFCSLQPICTRAGRSGALILFLVVLSHWLLDAIAHKHALAPGRHSYFGLQLWDHFLTTLLVEGGFWLLAIGLYIRATQPVKRAGIFAFWPVVAFFTFAWVSNIRKGPPPPNAVIGSLIFFALTVVWAYWMNRVRPAQGEWGRRGGGV